MYRVAICDDTSLQREINADLLEIYSSRNIQDFDVRLFASGTELLSYIRKNGAFDIYILDQVMPLMDGISTAEKVRTLDEDGIIIFVSSVSDAVFDAFKVRAFGYLLKPVGGEVFADILNRAVCELDRKKGNNEFVIHSPEGDVRVSNNDIIYAEKCGQALDFHLEGSRTVSTTTLRSSVRSACEKLLEEKHFFLAGVSLVVNLKKIASSDGESKPICVSRMTGFRAMEQTAVSL